MRPLQRKHVNKSKSAKKFSHGSAKTKHANINPNPMRGGIRL
ncbi:MAG: hypothetical protein [Microvirus sp.]|nr:MAG: hypothetical protein [Microvirus sp.]